jgi:hypothetical protein
MEHFTGHSNNEHNKTFIDGLEEDYWTAMPAPFDYVGKILPCLMLACETDLVALLRESFTGGQKPVW